MFWLEGQVVNIQGHVVTQWQWLYPVSDKARVLDPLHHPQGCMRPLCLAVLGDPRVIGSKIWGNMSQKVEKTKEWVLIARQWRQRDEMCAQRCLSTCRVSDAEAITWLESEANAGPHLTVALARMIERALLQDFVIVHQLEVVMMSYHATSLLVL